MAEKNPGEGVNRIKCNFESALEITKISRRKRKRSTSLEKLFGSNPTKRSRQHFKKFKKNNGARRGSVMLRKKIFEKKRKAYDPPKDLCWDCPTVSKSNCCGSSAANSVCWIGFLPEELLLKIFGYLPLGTLLHTVPRVCKKWEVLALDWSLWKTVEDLTIRNMVISTPKLKNLLGTIPRLKKLELIQRYHKFYKTWRECQQLQECEGVLNNVESFKGS